ncbi:MAG: 4-(cytidine 5'-diphospho)-2-C-methyl-D-erythritol kinase [Ignavibacteriaceae bacterium]
MDTLRLNSPAKLNFGLNIISKRPDGYHNIETIFYPIKLHDEIIIKKSNSFTFKCNIGTISTGKDNLVIKALNLLEEFTGQQFQADINLKKNIPVGAGLGGGSSNAASILRGINSMFNLNIPSEDLFSMAVKLGSDVPFFLDPKSKVAAGKGEILKLIDFKIKHPVLIVNPGIHVSTSWAYSKVKPKTPVKNLNSIIENGFEKFSQLKGIVTNDFEKSVFEKFPEIKKIKNILYRLGAEFALMTGSGSTLFGIFPELNQARKAEKHFSEKYFTFIHTDI